MLFISAVISSFLLASTVQADRRAASNGIVYTNNWAGAIWDKGNGTFKSVTGTFTVPVLSGPHGSGASAWVGIDGDTCTNSLFRAGVNFVVDKNKTSYKAWYKWYPDNHQHLFSDFHISAGDAIRVTVVANSDTTGTATVENLTHGQSVRQHAESILALCGQNAEWIVEDFGEGDDLASFANFGAVTFTNAKAIGAGKTYTPNGATALDIEQNNQLLTSVSISGSSLTVKYV